MKKSQVYKCSQCQLLVTVLKEGQGESELSCCGKKMIDVTPPEAKRILNRSAAIAPGTP